MEDGRRFAGLAVWAVRIALLAGAVALLWWSDRLQREVNLRDAAEFRSYWGGYWLVQTAQLVTGIAFAVAVRFPFSRSRFAWSRLVLGLILILPVVYY